jgi:hypothetical protein
MLSNGEFVVNAKSTSKYRRFLDAINSDSLPGFALGTPTQQRLDDLKFRSDSADVISRINGSLSFGILLKAKDAKIEVDSETIKSINSKYLILINQTIDDIAKMQEIAKDMTEESRASMNKRIDATKAYLTKMIEEAKGGGAKIAGETLANNFHTNFKTGLLDTMKNGDWAGFSKKIANNFSDQVTSTFIDGLMEPITGPEGFVNNMMKKLGSDTYKTGSTLGGVIAAPGNAAYDVALTPSISFFDACVRRFDMAVQAFSGKPSSIDIPSIPSTDSSYTNNLQQFSSTDPSYNPTPSLGEAFGSTLGGLPINTSQNALNVVDPNAKSIASSSDSLMGDLFSKSNLTYMAGAGMIVAAISGSMSGGKTDWIATGLAIAGTVVGMASKFAGPSKADGGLLSGPGTGTSDSILARVSNGEFVVNAKDTARNLGLLTRLNSGARFASGGLVGNTLDMPMNSTSLSKDTGKVSNSSTVNINVTGDISRQTRSEIMKMIPNISSGVNMYNREHAY